MLNVVLQVLTEKQSIVICIGSFVILYRHTYWIGYIVYSPTPTSNIPCWVHLNLLPGKFHRLTTLSKVCFLNIVCLSIELINCQKIELYESLPIWKVPSTFYFLNKMFHIYIYIYILITIKFMTTRSDN